MNQITLLLLAAASILLPGFGLVLLGLRIYKHGNWITGPLI